MVTLRDPLGDAAEPENAAANLLEWIGGRMQAGGVSTFQNPASEFAVEAAASEGEITEEGAAGW